MSFTVACAQIAPKKAEVEQNLDRIAETISQAALENVDLIVFPETATTGYFLEGGVLEASLTKEQLLEKLCDRVKPKRPIDALVGFYQNLNGNLHNSAAYIEFGPNGPKLVAVYQKFFLPTYGVFDEERFVSRGRDIGVFDTRLGRMAVLICEDIWHSFLPALCAVMGAQVILIPAASPGRGFSGDTVENLDRYRRLMTAVSEEHGVFCINCQLCGFEGGKGFVGGSMVVDPMGKLIASSPIMDEHLLIAELDLGLIPIARAGSPLVSDLQSAWDDIRRIVDEC